MRKYYAITLICCLAALAYFQRYCPQLETQNSASRPTYCDFAEQDPAQARRAETRARWLIVITLDTCAPCHKFKKEVLSDLQKEGYLITVIDKAQWDRTKVDTVPSLFYLKGGEILYAEVGYKTAEHIKKKLEKP